MNEAGLAVGMADVPGDDVPPDPAKPTIGSLGVIREMLDHAASVEEAIALLLAHNIDFSGGPPLHYLLADRTGRAAVVEHYGGSVHVTYNEGPWLRATNFLVGEAGEATNGRCWRYDQIGQRLGQAGGKMTPAEAMDLLASVGQQNTQWSVVYGMATGAVQVVMGRSRDAVHRFDLPTRAASP